MFEEDSIGNARGAPRPNIFNIRDMASGISKTVQEMQISVQNILAIIATFVTPFLLQVIGTSPSVAFAIGLGIFSSFILFKARVNVRPKVLLIGLGTSVWLLLLLVGLALAPGSPHSPPLKGNPPVTTQQRRNERTVNQTAGPCASNIAGDQNRVAVDCGKLEVQPK